MQLIIKCIKCLFALTVLFTMGNCRKLVDTPPPRGSISESNVFSNDETAISVVTAIYASMANPSVGNGSFTGMESMSAYTSLAADELSVDDAFGNNRHFGYYRNSLSANTTIGSELWRPLYSYIYKCNEALEGLEVADALTPAVNKQLRGEVRFLRAFFYLYLTNLFGDVPLATTTDYKVNTLLGRAPKSQVYQLIIEDLRRAAELLSSEYLDGSLHPYTGAAERVRPTSWAAKSLLSRAYLYTGDYVNAESEATAIINNTTLYGLTNLNETFLMNSLEAIWQLQTVVVGHNTEDGWTFILPSNGPDSQHPFYLNPELLNSFESNDQRRIQWIDSVIVLNSTYHFPFKYKSATLDEPVSEYLMVLRLAELYLIRAEARVQVGNIQGASDDLNAIRARAGLANTTAVEQADLFTKIQHERKVELFTEWAHRWIDLKRTNGIDDVMSVVTPLKSNGVSWKSYQQLFPLPTREIQFAPNLIQNIGY
jgi:starch-binding outer membrane protein, SusD/RagB family